MEIFASYDLTRCAWSAAQLVGCDPKTVQRYVDLRDAGLDPFPTLAPGPAHRPLPGEGGGVGGAFAGQDPRGRRPRPAAGDGLLWQREDHAPGSSSGQGDLPGRPPADLPALAAGAGWVAAVRLGGRAAGERSPDAPVLRLAGLVAVSGGAADLGPQAGHAAGLPGRDPAPAARCADLPADGQRA